MLGVHGWGAWERRIDDGGGQAQRQEPKSIGLTRHQHRVAASSSILLSTIESFPEGGSDGECMSR